MKKILFILSVSVSILYAETSPATSGYQFLKMQVGARAAGMAGAFVAVPNDIHGMFYNPALIAGIETQSATFSYQDDLLDINSGFLGYVRPQMGPGQLGISVLYRDYGSFDKTDESGAVLGSFGASNTALALSYGITPIENVHAGASIKYIRGMIDNYSADAVAIDLGGLYYLPEYELAVGIALSNLGFGLSEYVETQDDLPLHMRFGVSKRLAHLPLLLGLNFYKFNDEDWFFALGGEFTLSPSFFLRIGYDSYGPRLAMESSKDTFAGAAIGLGFLWNTMRFDYSFSTLGELGSLNRFSVSGTF